MQWNGLPAFGTCKDVLCGQVRDHSPRHLVRWWKAYLYFAMKNVHDCSSTEADIKRELDSLRGNECQGPTFSEKIYDHTVSSFCCVHQFGQNSNDTFWNATERCLALLFKKRLCNQPGNKLLTGGGDGCP
jgi:hypothetical protein